MATMRPEEPASDNTLMRKSAGHLGPLDGLRAIAVGLVVAAHYKSPLTYGRFGVTIFFFLSGFLISRLLFVESQNGGGRIRIGAFYARRFLRLFPALALFLVVFGTVSTWYLLEPPRPAELAAGFFYFENYYALALERASDAGVLRWEILWSLAVEEHFYLVFPAVFALLHANREMFRRVIVTGCLMVLAWRTIGIYGGLVDARWTYLATDSRIDSILYGVALSSALEVDALRNRLIALLQRPRLLAAIAALALLASLEFGNPRFRATASYSVQGFGLTIVFLLVCFDQGPIAGRVRGFLATSVMSYVGRISYPIYLWHLGCYRVAERFLDSRGQEDGSIAVALVALALTLAVASASYVFVEKPVLRLRRYFPPASRPA